MSALMLCSEHRDLGCARPGGHSTPCQALAALHRSLARGRVPSSGQWLRWAWGDRLHCCMDLGGLNSMQLSTPQSAQVASPHPFTPLRPCPATPWDVECLQQSLPRAHSHTAATCFESPHCVLAAHWGNSVSYSFKQSFLLIQGHSPPADHQVPWSSHPLRVTAGYPRSVVPAPPHIANHHEASDPHLSINPSERQRSELRTSCSQHTHLRLPPRGHGEPCLPPSLLQGLVSLHSPGPAPQHYPLPVQFSGQSHTPCLVLCVAISKSEFTKRETVSNNAEWGLGPWHRSGLSLLALHGTRALCTRPAHICTCLVFSTPEFTPKF